MRFHFLASVFLLALSVSACIREPGCEPIRSDGNIQIILHWPETEKNPPGIFIFFYPENKNLPVKDFLPAEGGSIYIPEGTYNILAYSNRSETINFRGSDAFNTVEAFVEKESQPDLLFAGSQRKIEVEGPPLKQTVELEMNALVKSYPFTYRGVKGLNNVSQIQVYVSGISTAVALTEPERVLPTDSIRCSFSRSADGFYGAFRSFGHGDDSTAHSFTVRFESGAVSKTYTYDVTEMLNIQERIDITDSLVFVPVANGGFLPGVNDWEDDSTIVPL